MSIVEYANVTAARRVPRVLKTTGDGYGDRLPTQYQVQLNGSTVWRNVFAICWSNAASFYVNIGGDRKFVRESAFDTAKGT